MQLTNIYPFTELKLRCIGALAVLMAMCSCSDDQQADAPRVPVQIYAYMPAPSRATVPLDGSVYSLWAKMMFTSDTQSNLYYSSGNPTKLTYNPSTSTFSADGCYYPITGKLSIAAVGINSTTATTAPADIIVSTSSTSYVKNLHQITVNLLTSDGTQEVIFSDLTTIDCTNPDNYHVTLRLHRPYAGLTFNFIPVDTRSSEQIVINKIEIPNVSWQGRFLMTYDSDGVPNQQSWTVAPTPATKIIEFSSTQKMGWNTEKDEAVPLTYSLFLLKPVARQQIIIYYTVYNATTINGQVTDNDDNVRHLRYIIPADPTQSWLINYQYTYNITVHGNSQMDYSSVNVVKVESGTTGDMHI